MMRKNFAGSLKNAVSTIVLFAGAFFVCSTVLSVRAVFADPITPLTIDMIAAPQVNNARGATTNRASGRTNPRAGATTSRRTVARTAVPTTMNAAPARAVNQSRAVTSRATSVRADNIAETAQRSNAAAGRANAGTSRNVVSRANAAVSRANARQGRVVRARTATTQNGASGAAGNNTRIALQGSAIRGSRTTPTTSYSYLSGKLYTGNYSNIIDSATGLISDDAFSNCMESYYTCMDEICTARNAAQRRCACAGRVKAFAEAEAALETANEELIKVSGELALLVASGGKDISDAFKLTDAEKVMNCVSWKDVSKNGTASEDEFGDWCEQHAIFDETCSNKSAPSYCSAKNNGNNFGFNIDDLDGNGSDILASLQAWANAKEQTITILTDDTDDLFNAFTGVSDIVGGLSGISGTISGLSGKKLEDTLAETWGYDLFAYAHNEVCSRVLDSCFNGIYEACGSPSSFGGKCANGQVSSCPFNYNSKIEVSSAGDIKLNERGTSVSTNTSATCFGYTSTSGDPYSDLRGPVADARRSIMNKYLLDANADCDAYGEQLRATAQNIGYQKVAAQQALQQKRLEFAQQEKDAILTAAQSAMSNFNQCLDEIYECYTETAESEDNWPTSRIKTYCAQLSNVPHCYEEMICSPSGAQFIAVIDEPDSAQCANTQDYTTNTCRNIVTLNEILNGAFVETQNNPISGFVPEYGDGVKLDSAKLRESCLRNAMGIVDGKSEENWNIRNWKK